MRARFIFEMNLKEDLFKAFTKAFHFFRVHTQRWIARSYSSMKLFRESIVSSEGNILSPNLDATRRECLFCARKSNKKWILLPYAPVTILLHEMEN